MSQSDKYTPKTSVFQEILHRIKYGAWLEHKALWKAQRRAQWLKNQKAANITIAEKIPHKYPFDH